MDSQDQKTQEETQKKHQQLLYKISYQDDPQSQHPRKYKYSAETLLPFLYFYKLLALRPCERTHKNQLVLNIPDTIVFNDGDTPVRWFFTNENGEVTRLDNVPYNQITEKICDGALDKQLVALLKKPTYGYGGPSGNQVKAVSSSEIKTVLSLILGNRSEISVIQKFVKSWSVKPSIVRTCWRSSGNNQSWTINSNFQYTSKAKVPEISKFVVNTKLVKGFRATKNVSEKFTKETLKYVKNIVEFVSRNLKIHFKEFVCDFVKDGSGNWWFINVKAFILQNEEKVNIRPITMHDDQIADEEKGKKSMETYTKCKKCKYCYKILGEHLMTHKLTLMMIMQCDQHLIRLGKSFPWLQRSYKHHVSNVNLYVEHKVCDSCYKLYSQVQKLVELQMKMSKLIGVSLKGDNKNAVSITSVPAFKGQSPQFGSRLQKVKYDTQMPQKWGFPLDQEIAIGLQSQNTKHVNRCKFMIFVHGIRDIPKQFSNTNSTYSLSYSFMGHNVKYSLNMNQTEDFENMLKLKIDKMKVVHFFSQSRQNIVDFIKDLGKLRIQLLEDGQIMGTVDLELDDFKSERVIKKDFFKMFSGPKVFPYLSWGLFISLGLSEGKKVEASTLKFVRRNHILTPQLGYHCPDLLPQQWIQMLEQKPDIFLSQLTLPIEHADSNSFKTNSQYESKSKIQKQLNEYNKKRVISHQNKRKVYY